MIELSGPESKFVEQLRDRLRIWKTVRAALLVLAAAFAVASWWTLQYTWNAGGQWVALLVAPCYLAMLLFPIVAVARNWNAPLATILLKLIDAATDPKIEAQDRGGTADL
jgi:hypothetical protein